MKNFEKLNQSKQLYSTIIIGASDFGLNYLLYTFLCSDLQFSRVHHFVFIRLESAIWKAEEIKMLS